MTPVTTTCPSNDPVLQLNLYTGASLASRLSYSGKISQEHHEEHITVSFPISVAHH